MMCGGAFLNANHIMEIKEERQVFHKNRGGSKNDTLKGLVGDIIGTNWRLIIRTKNTCAWLNICGTTVTGIVCSAMEFRDLLQAHYNIAPLKLQIHCNGYYIAFKVRQTLRYSKGGLVIEHHKKVCDELLYLSRRAFISASVRTEPLIHQRCTRSEWEIYQESEMEKYTRGDIMIRGLWYQQDKAIIDVKIGNANTDS